MTRIILGFSSLVFLFVYLPFMRGLMDAPGSYPWATYVLGFAVSGTNYSGQYPALILGVMLYLFLFYSAFQLRDRWIFLGLSLLSAASWLIVSFRFAVEGAFIVRGDTMGMSINMGWILLGTGFIVTLLIILNFIMMERYQDNIPPINRHWLLITLAFLPVQLLLLRIGSIESWYDRAGVAITIFQALTIPRIFRSRSMAVKASPEKASNS